MSMMRNGDSDVNLPQLPALPPGWCWTTLSAIADIDGGITKDQKREQTATMRAVPYLRVANVQRGYLDLEEMKTILADADEIEALCLCKGDVLFTEGGDRDKLGRGWVWNGEIEECIHQNHIFRARLCLPLVEPKFVSFHGNFFGQDWFTRTGKQTTNLASINKGVLSRFPVPLAPLNEQRRIVAKIEELFSDLDAGVAALKRVKANLKRYRAAVLQAAVTGRLTAEWRTRHPDAEPASSLLQRILTERRQQWEKEQLAKYAEATKEPPKGWQAKYPEPVGPDTGTLPGLPKNWCWASVEQVAGVQGGIQKQPKRAPVANCYPFLRVANVLRGQLDLEEVHQIELFGSELEKLRLKTGDMLIVEGNGSKNEIGRCAVWHGEIEDCVHQNHIIRVRCQRVLPQYLTYYWNSPHGTRRVTDVAASTSGLYTLSVGKISSLPLPLPPLAEQAEIAQEVERRLSILEGIEAQVEADLKRAARLRQSILKRAFEGRLVPQVATDEPASALLERIRREGLQPTQPAGGTAQDEGHKPKRKDGRGVFYRRAAVVCYVVKRLSSHKHFGRTQLEKVLHLSQSHLGIDLSLEFKRYAAGPFDEVIYKLEGAARKNQWFTKQDRPTIGVTYQPAEKTDELCGVAVSILGDKQAALDQLLDHFTRMDTDQAELLATAYAAWNDLLLDGRPSDEEAIIKEIYGWDESKAKFDRPRILACLEWMRKQGYVPTGTGQRTQVLERKTRLPSKRKARKPKDTGG